MIFDVRYVLIFQTVRVFTYLHMPINRLGDKQNVSLKNFLTIKTFIYMIFLALRGTFRGNVHGTPDCDVYTLARQSVPL